MDSAEPQQGQSEAETSRLEQIRRDHFGTDPRPVTALANDYMAGAVIPLHRHSRGQLIHAISGVMTVWADAGSWVVPPGHALWVPAGIEHQLQLSGVVRMRTVFAAVDARPGLPEACQVIEVSPLLREAILEAVKLPLDYELGQRSERIMGLVLDELLLAEPLALHVPMPVDARLADLCACFLVDPSEKTSLDDWAVTAGMSSRTLTRAFQRETGLSVGEWRRRARLLLCLPQLASGASVLQVAMEHGYDSPSAFASTFRKTFGASPSSYFRRNP
jgi:AraC-like DNA-binding protein/quercetin dioxygenase-like cupin family protein